MKNVSQVAQTIELQDVTQRLCYDYNFGAGILED